MQKVFCLGLHKTGSTSLQRFLLRNQIALARSGMIVPPVTPEAQARFMAEALGLARMDRPVGVNEYMAHNALAYQMIAETLPGSPLPGIHAPMGSSESVLHMVASLSEKMRARSVVFCSEDLARASLAVPDVPARFADTLGEGDTVLFAILRRPDEAIAAWQTQLLRFGRPFAPVRETGLGPYLGTVHLEYKAALEPWLRAYPRATLRFLPYDFALRRGGSVRCFRALDPLIFLPNDLVPVADANPGVPHALIEIARRAPGRLGATALRQLVAYLGEAAGRMDMPSNRDVDLFTPQMRLQLVRGFADTHHWLSQTTGRVPFFADFDEILAPRPWTDLGAAAEMLPELARDVLAAETPEEVRSFILELNGEGLT